MVNTENDIVEPLYKGHVGASPLFSGSIYENIYLGH